MCFGGKDDDPTQQPIKITQATEAQQSEFSAPSKRKEEKKRPHTDSDDHWNHSEEKSEKIKMGSGKPEPSNPPAIDRKELRRKYGKRKNAENFSGPNFDCTAF
jgi:hypothetical protein